MVLVAVLAFVLAACEPVTAPTTTTLDVLPPPDPIGSTTTVPVRTTTRPDTWTALQFPGRGGDNQIVWTGTEFLSWGLRDFQTFDAWRFTPPPGFAGGDDTS